jgi:formate dehydrogenase
MPHHGMTPHVSGTTLSAQARCAPGVREVIECWFAGQPIRDEYLIVDGGKLAGVGASSYTPGPSPSHADSAATKPKSEKASSA